MKPYLLLAILLTSCELPDTVAPKPTVAAISKSNTQTRQSVKQFRDDNKQTQKSIESGDDRLKNVSSDLDALLGN